MNVRKVRASLGFNDASRDSRHRGPSGIGTKAIAGRTYALADLRMFRFTGFPAWIVWAVVHIYFLIGFANRFFVMLQWVLTFLTKRRQVRVFPEERSTGERAA